jgi:beta-lactamase regulating signal transducer with metallopeptidase domain/tetratricopeptide (TPR) repeat protein
MRAALYRQLLWLYCLIGIAVLPVVWLYGPKLTLAILPAQTEPTVIESTPAIEADYEPVPGEAVLAEIDLPEPAEVVMPTVADSQVHSVRLKVLIAGIWLAGVILMLARLALGWYRLGRICRSASPANWDERFGNLGQRKLRILASSQVDGPVCFGLFRPTIIIPRKVYKNSTGKELQMVLAHEMAHIERKDCLVNLLQRMVEAVFFFHPLVWWASLQLTQEREQICDNYVVAQGASATDYTALLAQIVEQGFVRRQLGTVALLEGRLLSRVRFLLNPDRSKKIRLSGWASAAAAVVFLILMSSSAIRLKAMSLMENVQDNSKASYKIECSIDQSGQLLEGTEIISFTNDTPRPINQLAVKWLRQGSETLYITSKGKGVSYLTDVNSSRVVFKVPEAIKPGDNGRIEIKFNGVKPAQTANNKIGFVSWYPRLDWSFETHADYDVKINAPSEYTVLTSGIFDDSATGYHAQGVKSFIVILCKEHKVMEANAKDVLVRCVYTPKGEECARLVVDTAVDAINFYRERFGFYPYRILTIIPGMNHPAGGYPVAPCVVAIHGMEQFDSVTKLHWQWITAHEIGHQYCGEYMLSKDPADSFDWLMIGLGIYADREYTQARGLGLHKHQAMMKRYVSGARSGLDTTINRTAEERSKIQFDFNNVVEHGKSYSVISALDCVLGKDVFGRVYQRCLKKFAGRRLGVSEFQTVCEEESGQDLGWFFDQWVNSNKFLSYEISSQKSEKLGSRYKSKIEVKCLGSLKMPVPVAVYFEDGSSEIKFTERLLDTNVLEFESKSLLKDVRLDPLGKLAMVVPPPSADSKVLGEMLQLPWSGAGNKALELFNQAKELKQTDYEAWGKLGLNLYDGRYYAEALEAFRRIVEVSEKKSGQEFVSFVALVWQGHLLDILDKREEALKCYQKALKIDADFVMRHDQWGMVIDREWVEKRIKKPFQQSSPVEQELSKDIQQLPWTGAGKDALNVFNKAKEGNLSNPGSWFKLGLTLYDGQYYKEALEAFQRTHDLSGKTSYRYLASLVWQGHIFDLIGQREDALSLYEAVLKEERDFQVRHDQYGLKVNRDWVKKRLEKPFERPTTQDNPATKTENNLEVLDTRIEPIHQGKNVVRVEVKNNTDEEQTFAIHIYTRSVDYGAGGIGWGTRFFDTIKAEETKWSRFVFKIQGPVTDNTWLKVKFYNPESVEAYDHDKPFQQKRYASSDLVHQEDDAAAAKPASASESQAVIRTFEEIQAYIREQKYENAWQLFTRDYREAEFQTSGIEKFKKAMEPTHALHSAFVWEKDDFLNLKPARDVTKKGNVFTLRARLEDSTWKIDFAKDDAQWKIDWIAGYRPAILDMQEAETKKVINGQAKSTLEIMDIKVEPIRQGQNVVHVKVKNTSVQDQVFATYIQTRSPSRGWGTTFIDTIEAGQTEWTRHACKIFDSITDDTWIRLQLYNPGPAEGFDREQWFSSKPWDKWFKKVKYFGNDLEHYEHDQSQVRPASKSQAESATEVLRQLQNHIKNKEYEAAWNLFTPDFREAEFQISGFEWFKKCMESPQRFYVSSKELLSLEPKSVNKRSNIVALTATMKGELGGKAWTVNFVETEGKWKINSIERIDDAAKKLVDGHAKTELEVSDIKIDPIRQGKNVVRVELKNNSAEDQMFRMQIYTRSPNYGRSGVGWGNPFFRTIEAEQTKQTRFAFKIHGPITDATYVRLDFHNPGPAATFDMEKWKDKIGQRKWFKRVKYSSSELEQYKADASLTKPVSKGESQAIIQAFREIQGHVRDKQYEQAWQLFTKDYQDAEFQVWGFEKFKQVMEPEKHKPLDSAFWWEKDDFLSLQPESVLSKNGLLALTAKDKDQTWTIDFVEDAGRWKIDWIAGYTPRILFMQNWEQRLLPKMEKRSTEYFDIYYGKGSTAEKDIERIASDREAGHRTICDFLGTKSHTRIKLILFESEETKWSETGHQGRGWQYGNTMVEVYNEQEQLDPYHETTHVLMGPFGNPPALFVEGFAVYLAERLGAHALEDLGGGQAKIYERVKLLKENGELINLRELLTYTEIGSKETRPPVAYAEAASFVKFLIDQYGKDKFMQAYKTLRNSDDTTGQEENIRRLEQIYGESLTELEKQWETAFSL